MARKKIIPPEVVGVVPEKPTKVIPTPGVGKTRGKTAVVEVVVAATSPQQAPKVVGKHPRKVVTKTDVVAPTSPAKKTNQPDAVRIFQIHYLAEQREKLDPQFEPYDNSGDESALLEFNVFKKLSRTHGIDKAKLWGALSWKFQDKTGLTGVELRSLIEDNPGFDVYFCNPSPEIEALYHNLWLQGEVAHPNFISLCIEVFKAAGLPPELLIEIHPSTSFSTANYFVATPKFWDAYLAFVNGVLERADKNLSQEAKEILYSSTADVRGMHAGATYLPFIVERLFTTFLLTQGKMFRACKLPAKALLGPPNVHIKLLKQMKDAAHRTRSSWMAACWINYRNLYLAQTNGKPWLKTYLRAITPSEIRFAGLPPVSADQDGR